MVIMKLGAAAEGRCEDLEPETLREKDILITRDFRLTLPRTDSGVEEKGRDFRSEGEVEAGGRKKIEKEQLFRRCKLSPTANRGVGRQALTRFKEQRSSWNQNLNSCYWKNRSAYAIRLNYE
ncbi:Protein of unknown function [Gryllus bimaculatus]|nr:Protein of unknown function [Gryllus bimaculatus]